MNKEREALKLALNALEKYQTKRQDFDRFADEITAIKEALAQPSDSVEQEPDWDAMGEAQLASIKRDTRVSLEDAAVRTIHKMAEPEQNNFCPRCGKRRGGDVNYIHTCTPPARGTMAHYTPRTFDDYGNKIV